MMQKFNWTKIAVVYVNDAYGLYLSIGIADLSLAVGIEATTVAFSRDEIRTLDIAAEQVKKLNTYIIVFIVHIADSKLAFEAFEEAGLTGYPI